MVISTMPLTMPHWTNILVKRMWWWFLVPMVTVFSISGGQPTLSDQVMKRKNHSLRNRWEKTKHWIKQEVFHNFTKIITFAGTSCSYCFYLLQEHMRFDNPHRSFTYCLHGYEAVVGPVKGVYVKDSAMNKAREHALLVNDRPAYVTILTLGQHFLSNSDQSLSQSALRFYHLYRKCVDVSSHEGVCVCLFTITSFLAMMCFVCLFVCFLVRDAAARLPNGEGTRSDICELLKDSSFLAPGITDAQVRLGLSHKAQVRLGLFHKAQVIRAVP